MIKIFSILLSLQLIMAPVAMAEEKKSSSADQFRANSKAKNGGMGFYTNQILGIGTAVIGSTIITQCKFTKKLFSLPIFMAGSLIYIASEIMGGKAQNEAHLKRAKDLKMLEEKLQHGGDLQKEAINSALKEEKETLEFIRKRKKWMTAVTAVYYGAMAAAIIEQINASMCMVKTTGVKCFVEPGTPAPAVEIETPQAPVDANAPQTQPASTAPAPGSPDFIGPTQPTAPAPGSPGFIGPSQPTAPAPAPKNWKFTPAYGPGSGFYQPINHFEDNSTDSNILEGLVNFIIPSAHAQAAAFPNAAGCKVGGGYGKNKMIIGAIVSAYSFGAGNAAGGKLTKYATMAVGLGAMVDKVGSKLTKLVETPKARIITFGAAGVLSTLVTKGLSDKEKIVEDNVAKLEKIKAQFDSQTDDNSGIAVAYGGASRAASASSRVMVDPATGKKYLVKELPGGNSPRTCLARSGESIEASQRACAKPLALRRPDFNSKMNIPTISSISSLATEMGNATARGDMGRADVAATGLAQMAGRMTQVKDNLLTQLNDVMKKKGDKTNFEDEINKQIAEMAGGVSQSVASQGGSLADLDSGAAVSLSTAEVPQETTAEDLASSITPSERNGSVNVSEGPTVEGEPMTISEGPRQPESMDNFNVNVHDISKSSETSIFDQLSNRYKMNYSRIFDKKSISEREDAP